MWAHEPVGFIRRHMQAMWFAKSLEDEGFNILQEMGLTALVWTISLLWNDAKELLVTQGEVKLRR